MHIHNTMYKLFFLLVFLLTACNDSPPAPPRQVKIIEVKVGPLTTYNHFTGEIVSQNEILLSFVTSGKVETVPVMAGDTVKAGQKVAQLNNDNIAAQMAQAKTRMQQAQKQANHARQALNHARRKAGTSSLPALERAYRKAGKALKDATTQLQQTTAQANRYILKASHSGTVTDVLISPGETIMAGQPVLRMTQGKYKAIQISVAKERLPGLKLGQTAKVIVKSDPDTIYDAEIQKIQAEPNAKNFHDVRLRLLHQNTSLPLGTPVNVIIAEATQQQGALIPKTALQEQNDTATVWVVDPISQTLHQQSVHILQRSENNVMVSGLADNTHIVASGIGALKEKQVVDIADTSVASGT